MDALAFLAVIACLGLVVFWHEVNARAGSQGEKGLLAINAAPRVTDAPAYRERKRRGALAPPLEQVEAPQPAYRPEGKRAAFRPRENTGYRSKDRTA